MKKAPLILIALLAAPLGCEETPPPVAPPAPPPAVVAPPPVEAAKPEPTPEEKKKAEEEKKKAEAAQKLAVDRAQWEADSSAEAARWTPAMRAEAKKLGSAKYPTLKAAITAALKGKHRKPTTVARDAYRHPLETLEFFGLKPGMTVLEYGPGDGWYTELLAPTLAAKGKLIVTGSDPKGPPEARSTFYGQRLQRFLDNAPEVYGKVERIVVTGPAPKLGIEGKLDMVILCRELHGMARDKMLTGFLPEVFKALKPGGDRRRRAAPRQGRGRPQRERQEGLPARGVGHPAVRGGGLQARGQVGDQRQPQGHQGLPRGRVDPAAQLRAQGQGPGEVRRDRRERPDDPALRQAEEVTPS